jgi:hypothetical protein
MGLLRGQLVANRVRLLTERLSVRGEERAMINLVIANNCLKIAATEGVLLMVSKCLKLAVNHAPR